MKQYLIAVVAAIACAVSTSALAATYTYTGNTYALANGSYTTAMSITGEFTTTDPLDPNLVGQDISGLVQTFSFSDGVSTITDANGTLATFNMLPGLIVSTDGAGDITEWVVFARDLPLATAVSETNDIIVIINTGALTVTDQGLADAVCDTVDGVPSCTNYVPGTPGIGANFDSAGSWVTTLPPPPPTSSEPIPGLSGFGLAITGFGLMLLGMRRLRR